MDSNASCKYISHYLFGILVSWSKNDMTSSSLNEVSITTREELQTTPIIVGILDAKIMLYLPFLFFVFAVDISSHLKQSSHMLC